MVEFGNAYDVLARTLYGESEANNEADAVAIGHVILNRVRYTKWPDTIPEVCLQPLQFSCWNDHDPGRKRILNANGPWWNRCQSIAQRLIDGAGIDPTFGATHYYATYIKTPKWARNKRPCHKVTHRTGHGHVFFNNIDTQPPATATEALNQSKPLAATGTVKAGTALSTLGGGTMLDAAVDIGQAVSHATPLLEALSQNAVTLLLGLAVLGLGGYIIYNRWQDRQRGVK